MTGAPRCALALALFTVMSSSSAQAVYRCENNGKTVYSHEPCLGARVVDVTPTEGLDKSSGVSRKGADVRREQTNRQMTEILRPVLGESAEERNRRHRRFKLSHAAQAECHALDPKLQAALPDHELFIVRRRYRELGC